jgi:hypothetical protein
VSANRFRGLSERQIRGLSKKIYARKNALDEAYKLRVTDHHRLLGTTDHELIEMKAKSDAFLTAAMMVMEALEEAKK